MMEICIFFDKWIEMVNLISNGGKSGIIRAACLLLMLKEVRSYNLNNNYEIFTTLDTKILGNRPKSVALFSCGNKIENVKFLKTWSLKGFQVNIQHMNQKYYMLESLKTKYQQLNVLVDLECETSNEMLIWASEEKLFSRQYKWLLFQQSKKQFTTLEHLKIPLDSQVIVVNVDKELALQDMYQITDGGLLQFKSYTWSTGLRLKRPGRDNYGGITIKTAIVVLQDVYDENFLDVTYPHQYHITNLNFECATYISQMLNFRMQIIVLDSWGTLINGTANYTGVVGFIQRGEAEWGALGISMKTQRLPYIDFAGTPITFGSAFMFLKPSLSEMTIIYSLPFDMSVWVVYLVTIVILIASLLCVNHAEKNMLSLTEEEQLIWHDSIPLAFGVICQQGTNFSPKSLSAKMAYALYLLATMFVFISYSAKIVSLLKESSNAINTLEDLIDSPFTISMRNVSYNIHYANESTTPAVNKLYKTKIYSQPAYESFTTQVVGVERIRKGLHAYYGDPDTYQEIANRFEEYEVCRLSEVKMITSQHLCIPVRKGSHYKKHIKQKLNWLRETGVIYRTYRHWLLKKPKCLSDEQYFVTVRLKDFYPTLLILACGVVFAILFLILEIIWVKYH